MISVITPTIRDEGLPLVQKALNRQTYREFEWIVQKPEGSKPEGYIWTLNTDYNKAIRKAKGELIISWQDYTFSDPEALERFWIHYQVEPNCLVGAVGNKYQSDQWLVETWHDPRIRTDQGSFYSCYPSDIEWNLCSVPKQALYDVGGFDENLDRLGYGMDGYSVNERIALLGKFDFKLDQSIRSYSLEHGRYADWDEKNLLGVKYNEYRRSYVANPKLKFLE